jgi:ankyrin repeat protein
MNNNVLIHILFFCSFSLTLHSMQVEDVVPLSARTVDDASLQQLIKVVNNSSLSVVNFIKKVAEHNNIPLTPEKIKPLLKLDQEQLDFMFLAHVDNDCLRPLLLSMGAHIKARDARGRNCLFFTERPTVLKELISYGAETNVADTEKRTALLNVLCFAPEKYKAAQVLLEGGADPNAVDPCFGSLLYRLVNSGDVEGVKLLCACGANTNATTASNRTPLMRAVELRVLEMVDVLLQRNANPKSPNNYNRYPLHMAMPEDDIENIIPKIVISLLSYGADPNQPYPYSGAMPLEIAIKTNNVLIVTTFLTFGAKRYRLSHFSGAYDRFIDYFRCSSEIADLFCE